MHYLEKDACAMKKFISLLMMFALVLCLAAPAMASGEPSGDPSAEAAPDIFSVASGEPFADRPAPEVIEGERYVTDHLRAASAIYVSGGEYVFDDVFIYGAGYADEDDLSAERSNQYGYCSDVLATSPESLVTLNNPTIISDPESYSNGVFATNCAKIIVNGGTIDTNNPQGHGIDVTYMGHVYAYDTVIHTAGSSSGALASDYGGGFITAEGIDCTTEMAGSPGIYCAGSSVIYVKDSTFNALNCEGLMSAHDHGVTVLENCYIFGEPCALNGHQAMPSPAMSSGSFAFVFGGTLETGSGPIVNQNNGRTETTLVGVECVLGDSVNAVNADANANGILVLNLWDTALEGNINCEAGASITVNIYDGASVTGEVTGEGEVIINVYEGGTYNGSFAANDIAETVEAPVCEDFDYYVINYWAAGNQKWQSGTITTYVETVEPLIIANSAASFVEEGASAIAYDPETTVVTESGIGMDALDTESAYGFGDPGDGVMGVAEASADPSAEPTAPAIDPQAAYAEYIHEWLLAEDAVNDTMTSDIVENEFMPLVEAGDYTTFPAEMLWNGMLENGSPMTFEEWSAQQ